MTYFFETTYVGLGETRKSRRDPLPPRNVGSYPGYSSSDRIIFPRDGRRDRLYRNPLMTTPLLYTAIGLTVDGHGDKGKENFPINRDVDRVFITE